MGEEGFFRKKTYQVAGASIFGSLATVVTIGKIAIAFPILPFLMFDIAEIFSVSALLLFGPLSSVITATVHWIMLVIRGGSFVAGIGPTMKLLAVLSTLLGMWAGYKISYLTRLRIGYLVFLMMFLALISRVGIMALANYVLYAYVTPFLGLPYITFIRETLVRTLGLELLTEADVILYAVLVVSLFNAIHVLFTLIPSFLIILPISEKVYPISIQRPWIILIRTRKS